MKKIKTPIFPKPKSVGKRNWGSELLLALIPKVLSLKKLKIKKGKQGGLQYHRKKNECGIILKGRLLIRYQNQHGKLEQKVLSKGKIFHFPPGAIHQEKALTDVEIIEASTPHFNDRVRVEKKFKIKKLSGLPTTKLKDINFL